MDRNEKLAAARKKLRKFQSRQAGGSPRAQGGGEGSGTTLSVTPLSSHTVTPASESPTPPQSKNTKLSSVEGLSEISQDILSHPSLASGSSWLAGSGGPIDYAPPTLKASSWSASSGGPIDHAPPALKFPSWSAGSGFRMDHAPPSVTLSPHHAPPTATLSPHHSHESNHLPSVLTATPNHFMEHERTKTELEKQVQVHIQTIDILVAEKSTLQSELSSTQTQLHNKKRECSDMGAHLQATRQKLEEIEREKLNMAEELARKDKSLSRTSGECVDLRQMVERLRSSLEDQQQENTELISKITSQSAEIHSLQTANTELQSKLNMAELLAQQLSAGTPPEAMPPPDPAPSHAEAEDLRQELGRVRGVVQHVTGERDQALSDLAALRDTLVQQQEDSTRRLAELQGKLAEADVQSSALSQEVVSLQTERESLLQRVSTEHAQLAQSSQAVMETHQQERDQLNRQLRQQVEDNAELTRLNAEQEERLDELELQLSRLQEQSVDQQSLLTTISQDKETISRAMSQNKELKTNIAELQDAFVRLSQQNMELASELETERHHVGQLQKRMGEAESRVESDHTPMVTGGETVTTGEPSTEGVNQQLQAVLLERDGLAEQLGRMREEHSALEREHSRILQQLNEATRMQEETDFDRVLGQEVDAHNLSVEEVTTLQNNFNALQQRFMGVMSEKADLLDKIQEHEHTIVQLAGETETIGEYITLYQTQREGLRAKFQEKDRFIQQLIAEKTAIEEKVHELQNLVRQLLAERTQVPIPSPTKHSVTLPPHLPPHTAASDIPFHLRPHSYGSSRETSLVEDGGRDSPLELTEDTPPPTRTAEQILQLLEQLETRGRQEDMMPCPCCTGQLIVV